MHTYNIATRTIAPTATRDKRVRVDSALATANFYPWDHTVPEEEVHMNVARRVAENENPEDAVRVELLRISATGYTFRVTVGEGGQ